MQGLLSTLLLFASLGWSQQVTGSIVGNVNDAQGAPVVGAKVRVRSVEQGAVVRTISTDDSGAYVARLLPIVQEHSAAAAVELRRVYVSWTGGEEQDVLLLVA
jgi:hypothetical protein